MSQKFWDEKFETMTENQMRDFQLRKLRDQLGYVYEKNAFYRESFDKHGVKPDDLKRLSDLSMFPFTVKKDLTNTYPFGMSCVGREKVARVHASSGTYGRPSLGLYTQGDLDQWTECMTRALWAQEVRPESVFQNAFGMGLFTGGMGFLQAAIRIGCSIIPSGTGMTERQIMLIRDLGVTALSCTASYIQTMFERARTMGVDMKSLSIKTGHFGAEPWTEEMRREIQETGGFKAYDHYGLTEMMGPGVAFNCEYYRLHINEDHILPEIIDPETLEPLPEGEKGEMVLTALQREAAPLIRYRTRDIGRISRQKCECGRTLITMDKVVGRTDDMMIISGVNVFPTQIESILMAFECVEPIYQIRLRKKGYSDTIIVETELKSNFDASKSEPVDEISRKISEKIRQVIGVKVPVVFLPVDTIPRSIGKAKRVLDERSGS